MIQYVVFAITGLIVYLLSAQLINILEKRRKDELPNRSLIFFIVFFALILLSFKLLQQIPGVT